MERQRKYIHKGKPKNMKKYLSQCHFVHHKSHVACPGTNPGLRSERPATNCLSHIMALLGGPYQYIKYIKMSLKDVCCEDENSIEVVGLYNTAKMASCMT
jgi:hypothetical protein